LVLTLQKGERVEKKKYIHNKIFQNHPSEQKKHPWQFLKHW